MSALDGRPAAFVFPGQGSQKVGMGRAWADRYEAARRTFEEADDVLGFPLSRLCWEGPEEELNLTVNTQPALLTVSTAIHRSLAAFPGAEALRPVAVAGHSLGEYSALVAAGALSFADALRLVRRRGQLMQEAVPVGVGAMAALIGMDAGQAAALAAEVAQGEVCAVANLNGFVQIVIAGHKGAIDRAVALARERGAKKATVLSVSAPFHSPLMAPAREGMTGPLQETVFRDPSVPVVTNVDAVPVTTGAAARDALIRQIDSPVRWVEVILYMAQSAGVDAFLEVGPGTVLTGLDRRIAVDTMNASLSDPDQLRKTLLGGEAKEEG
ncbi:MAG TPA: ACP S-malonyltransferase [Thermoanaerobaculia bacterium]|nr:ACP S-malonyltransferase [Thermoanaerobaculia bacterium]